MAVFSLRRHSGAEEILGRILRVPRALWLVPLDGQLRLTGRRLLGWALLAFLQLATLLGSYLDCAEHRWGSTAYYLLATERFLTFWAVLVSSAWLLLRRDDLAALSNRLNNLEKMLHSAGLAMQWEARPFNIHSLCVSFMVVASSTLNPIVIATILNILLLNTIIFSFVEFLCFIRQLFDTVSQIQDTNCLLACLDSINGILKKLMNCYGMVTFAIISSMFTRILCNVFIQTTQPFDKINLVWLCFAIYPIFLILESSFISLSKVEEMNNVIYRKALANSMDESLEFYLIAQRDVEFSSSGFFNLDNTLVLSMIGTVITYVVILIQYNSPT